MGLFIGALVVIIGVVAVYSGITGSGLGLFESVFGKTPTGTKLPTSSGPAPTTNPAGIPWTQVVAG